ncbi:MAG: phosphodiester glycosidase family protein [Anaerolineae bacterium]|nr:phosphodiester glycosidase family protein [Anaerolineae bacterium]
MQKHMVIGLIFLVVLGLVIWRPAPPLAAEIPPEDFPPPLLTTCHAEVRWSYMANLRLGPGRNWAILRELVHNRQNIEMRVIGQDARREWVQVVLAPPYQDMAGWVWAQHLNLFGTCDALPMTDSQPVLALEDVPPPGPRAEFPAFLHGQALSANDRAWLLNPGMVYVRRETHTHQGEPDVQAHILLMDLQAPQLRVTPHVGAIPDLKNVRVSDTAAAAGAFAAINGDYYGGNYMPQGITVIDGEIVTAPQFRAAFALTPEREPFIGYFTQNWTWDGSVITANGQYIPLQLMNLPCHPLWLCVYSHHLGQLPLHYGGVRVLTNAHFTVLDIVQARSVDIPPGHFVFRGGDATGQWLLDNVQVGDQLQVSMRTEPDWRQFESAISGGPRLVVEGAFWQDCDPEQAEPLCEAFDQPYRDTHYFDSSIPRTGLGYSADGRRLMAVVVEGYEVQDSRGMIQQELAALFLEFGISEAMELDGGGSSTLWINGSLINDHGEEGERAVSNMLFFYWDEGRP